MVNFLKVSDKGLFLRYAIPCGSVLVRRGTVSQELLDEMKTKVVNNEQINDKYTEVYKVALFFLTKIARGLGKKVIDKEVIHKYYFKEHDEVVTARSKVKTDVNEQLCRVKPGKILKINGIATVETPLGEFEVKLDFIPEAKIGDFITVHYDYGCEIISETLAKKLWKTKHQM